MRFTRHSRRLRTSLLAASALALASVAAVTAQQTAVAATCDDKLTGWASVAGNGRATTTGGGNATPQLITSLADLRTFGGDSTPRVLRISGTISTGGTPVDIASNKTVIGVDGNATIRGGLNIRSGSSNIIIRNLTIHGAGPNAAPADTLAARGSHHLWFDHLNLLDAGDGLLDLTQGSDFLTVSWVKFWYTNPANNHRLASLLGSSAEGDAIDSGKLNATYHHNWFAELVDQRMPRTLFGKGHVYNNYYTTQGNSYAIGVGALASTLIENNYFKNTRNPHQFMYNRPSYITARGNTYDNTTGLRDTGAGGQGGGVTPFTSPPYSYALDGASSVPDVVSRCAGPKLGTTVPPTTPPTTTPPTTRPPTSAPPTTAPPSTPPTNPPVSGACSATYRTVSSWAGGFQAEVTVTAGSRAINGWTTRWTLGSGQQVTQSWSTALSTSGTTVTARNVEYNGSLGASASTTFGFIANGTATTPTVTCTSP